MKTTISENHRKLIKIGTHIGVYIISPEIEKKQDSPCHTRVKAPHLVGHFSDTFSYDNSLKRHRKRSFVIVNYVNT